MIYAWVKWESDGETPVRRHKQLIVKCNTDIQSEIEDVMHVLGYGSNQYYLLKEFRGNDPLYEIVLEINPKLSNIEEELKENQID